MKRNQIYKLVLTALLAALTYVMTRVVQVPTVGGYTNLGDSMCLLAGLVLGPWYGFAAAGVGSALVDLLSGYAHYVPGTFVIKGLVALIELPSEAIMVLGYFGYKALILGKGLAAASSIPNNLVQAAVGIILSVLLYTALSRVPEIHKAFWKGE